MVFTLTKPTRQWNRDEPFKLAYGAFRRLELRLKLQENSLSCSMLVHVCSDPL